MVVNAIAPGQRRILWDDAAPGFGVRITGGSVNYLVKARIGGRQMWRTLGPVSGFPYKVALEKARAILAAARTGVDLTIDPRRDMPTFGEAWRQMIDDVDKPKLSPATIDDYEDRASRLILPKIGRKRLGDVTPADVDRLVSAATGQRNRAYLVTLVKKTFNYAKRARLVPAGSENPAVDIVVKKSTTKVARALETEEIAAFGKALAEMEGEGSVSPWLANLLRLSLICGLRPGEVRSMKWDRVNIPHSTMRVVGKTGEREIDLTEAAIGILTATPRIQGNEYVFAGRRYGEPLVAVYKTLGLVRARAGIAPFRPYDLRHSAATGALASGADVRAVQALLGHADLKTTSGYLHSSDKRRKAAAESASAFGRGVLKERREGSGSTAEDGDTASIVAKIDVRVRQRATAHIRKIASENHLPPNVTLQTEVEENVDSADGNSGRQTIERAIRKDFAKAEVKVERRTIERAISDFRKEERAKER